MATYSRHEVAERAGVGVELVSRMLDLGMLGSVDRDTFTTADIRKIGLVRDLVEGGLPLKSDRTRIADRAARAGLSGQPCVRGVLGALPPDFRGFEREYENPGRAVDGRQGGHRIRVA